MGTSQAERCGTAIRGLRMRQIGALPVLYPILDTLGVRQVTNTQVASQADIDLGRIVLLLTLNRLLAPQPLYHVGEWLAETVMPQVLDIPPAKVYDNRLGRALDRLYPHLGALWASLVSRAVRYYALDLNVLHWDITSVYFEGAYTDSELARYGYSRDHRPDTKQVNLEVDVTHDGYVPVLYALLRGNTADNTRPCPHLQHLLGLLARPELRKLRLRPILVSDCKLVTAAAVWACHQQDLFYLGPLANGTATDTVLHSVTAAELAAQPLAYRPQRVAADAPRFIPYQGVWRPYHWEYAGQQYTDRALVVWSAGKHRLDVQKRKTYLKRLLNKLADIKQKLNTRRYKRRAYVEQRLAAVQHGNPAHRLLDIQLHGTDGALTLSFCINRHRLATTQALDGRYALTTNAPHLDATTTLTLFKGQDGVEKRFRVIKGPLAVRPLFVRNDQRIEGLVFITLVALLVRAILERVCHQRGLAYTAERVLQAFATLQAVDLMWADGSYQRHVADMTPFQAQVLHTLEWSPPQVYASLPPLTR